MRNYYILQKLKAPSFLLLLGILILTQDLKAQPKDDDFVSHIIHKGDTSIRFVWKNDSNQIFGNFQNLNEWLATNDRKLTFAMNGGMYNRDQSPQGLYIEKGKLLAKIDTASIGYGNFYMKPNGVFYLTKDFTPVICKSEDYEFDPSILYATQSGPQLLIDGEMHPKFMQGSSNLNIRNGVGVLPDGNMIFAMSKEKINFYDFARYFQNKGCKYALYLDGFVSKTYLPLKDWIQLDGNFGVIIGQVE